MIFGGNSSHLSSRICLEKKNMIAFRQPSHLTYELQPLDKCVFDLLKTALDIIFEDYNKSTICLKSSRMTRRSLLFVQFLGKLWCAVMEPLNIICGFRNTRFSFLEKIQFNTIIYKPSCYYRIIYKSS